MLTKTQTKARSKLRVPLLDLKAQYASIRDEVQSALAEVFESQQFILGPQLRALESEIAAYVAARFAIGVGSGTDALLLTLRAFGIGPGDEVIVPAFTFFATAECVSLLGASPVFADIQPDTFTLDPEDTAAKITERTRAIIPVHLYGQAANMEPILELARRHALHIIEDNAQALGATYYGQRTGSLADAGCLSFYPTKNLGGWGDGGMVVTDSEQLAQRLRSLRDHGTSSKYRSQEIGWNSRLDEIQSAVLRVKLLHLDGWNRQRRDHAATYDNLLKRLPKIVTPGLGGWGEHVFHQYTIRIPERDAVQKALSEQGITTGIYYPVPLHLQPAYASLAYKSGSLPESERAAAEVLSLPIYQELSHDQIAQVVRTLSDCTSICHG
ncbi:MAG TPA: DegT/DnrJ/EryC1/StrS family aminotransferase [Terriglobales bacterium]|nr:DegT/DnrJ/EryC1/StrS family aminotransferase [Terriglobales bacterium]